MYDQLQQFDIVKGGSSKLLCTSRFLLGIKKHKFILEPFLRAVNDQLLTKGSEFLINKKNEKKLKGANNIYEFRSKIKGHRILFVFGYQLSSNEDIKDDIILCDYVVNHDYISKVAKSLNKEEFGKLEVMFETATINETSDSVDSLEGSKLYYFPVTTSYFLPLLNEEQKAIVFDDSDCVLVKGVAGSGKTNICISKILINGSQGQRVLYSTFSKSLLSTTNSVVNSCYILRLEDCKNKIIANDILGATNILKSIGVELEFVNAIDFLDKVENVISQLKQVEYKLATELTNKTGDKKVVDFVTFNQLLDDFATYDIKDRLKKTNLNKELIFNEVEGLIFGIYEKNSDMISKEKYSSIRQGQLNVNEIKLIYDIALSYREIIKKNNEFVDKNIIANIVENSEELRQVYDLVIVDEVQDFTERELYAVKHIAKKFFAVGDPSQMINPAYFSFAHLQDMFDYKKTNIYTLKLTYRNTSTLNEVVNSFNDVIRQNLGVYKNTRDSEAVESKDSTYSFYSDSKNIIDKLTDSEFNNYSIVVATERQKQKLKDEVKYNDKINVFTISEVKGLEFETVVLYNVLSNNKVMFDRYNDVNFKLADENFLLRYYFNLFYVGITRAQRHLLVIEENCPTEFKEYLSCYEYLSGDIRLENIIEKLDLKILSDSERLEQAEKAFEIFNYEIAEHYIKWIQDENLKAQQLIRLDIYKNIVDNKDYFQARELFLKNGFINDASKMSNYLQDFLAINFISGYERGEIDISIAYELMFLTKSQELEKLATMAVSKIKNKERQDILDCRQFIKEEL